MTDRSALKRLLVIGDAKALFDYISERINAAVMQWQDIIRLETIEREKKIDRLFTLHGEIEGLKVLRSDLYTIQTQSPDVSSESEDPSSASED